MPAVSVVEIIQLCGPSALLLTIPSENPLQPEAAFSRCSGAVRNGSLALICHGQVRARARVHVQYLPLTAIPAVHDRFASMRPHGPKAVEAENCYQHRHRQAQRPNCQNWFLPPLEPPKSQPLRRGGEDGGQDP